MSNSTNPSEIAEKGRRIALVIGVNEAPMSYMPSLKHAVADAEAMAEVLQQFGRFELLPPLLDGKAESAAIKKALLKLVQESAEEDILLLYFSGHGTHMLVEREDQPGVDQVYLVTNDFCEKEVEEDPTLHLSMRWLRDNFFNKAKARQVLLILDCCYAGDYGRTGPDPKALDLLQQIVSYFDLPGTMRSVRPGKLRLALTATGHNLPSEEKDGHGVMTGPLLQALSGGVGTLLLAGEEGQITLTSLYEYLLAEMPPGQKPSLSGDSAAQNYILTWHPERASMLRRKDAHHLVNERPTNYLPFPRNLLFQPRPGEFEQLETLLFGPSTEQHPARLGLVGVVGLGGVGKTQLAVELAYRCLDQQRFPAGMFWMPATGRSVFEWQHQFAELTFSSDYLPTDDDPSSSENEARRARHFCRYLATHKNALLILDNVEDPSLVTSALPALAGGELACTILYTSRIRQAPSGVITHPVKLLSEETALRLLLETTRPSLLSDVHSGSQSTEAQAAREICRTAGYLPLTLAMLRGLLEQDRQATLEQLNEALKQPGVLDAEKKKKFGDLALLSETFRLSWERVRDEGAKRLFKLAAYFPEAIPIPLWLLGLAAGLGESCHILNPLWKARAELQMVSLMEVLIGDQVRLHPLVRIFGRELAAEEFDQGKGKSLLEEAEGRLTTEFINLKSLENRALRANYWGCLEQVRAVRGFVELLGTGHEARLARIERWLDRESYLFRDEQWWPKAVPGLFYQQLHNRSVEEEHPLSITDAPAIWLRQMREVGAEGRSLLRIFAGHSSWVSSVAFSPDGKLALTGSNDGTARLWETESGKQVRTLLVRYSFPVKSVAFSPDGKLVLIGSTDGTAQLWETESGKQVRTLEGHSSEVNSVAFSPDGKLALTGSTDKTARLWETGSGKQIRTLEGHSSWVYSVAFSPDGKLVLTGSDDKTARLWEAGSGKQIRTLEGHSGWVSSVAFSPDSRLMLTGSDDKTARLWEAGSGKHVRTLKGHSSGVKSVAFSPDGRLVLTGSWDQTARLWEAGSGKQVGALVGHSDSVFSVAFSPVGKLVLTGSRDKTARLWEAGSGKQVGTLEDHSNWVNGVAFSPDGKLVLTGLWDKTARLWETESGKQVRTLEGHSSWVSSVAFSPDGKLVLTGSHDGTARLWETGSGKQVGRLLMGWYESVYSVAFSPDGKLVLTGSWDNTAEDQTARLWETGSGRQVGTLEGHSSVVNSVAFSPDGKLVLTGSDDGTARLWKTGSGKQVRTLKGHSFPVNSVAFSPDGKLVLTSSTDGTARLCETGSGKQVGALVGHSSEVNSVAFSPDGRLVITCDQDGRVFFWRVTGAERGKLVGLYVATYEVGAVYWQDATHVVLADKGGPHIRPHCYYLKLEGTW